MLAVPKTSDMPTNGDRSPRTSRVSIPINGVDSLSTFFLGQDFTRAIRSASAGGGGVDGEQMTMTG